MNCAEYHSTVFTEAVKFVKTVFTNTGADWNKMIQIVVTRLIWQITPINYTIKV